MTDTERGLLRTICLNPKDDLCRLVYADWLEENGREERAKVIRVQVEQKISYWCPLVAGAWPEVEVGDAGHDVQLEPGHTRVTLWVSRGFVSEWRGPCAVWMKVGPSVAWRHPLRVVRFTDKVALNVGDGEVRWDHPEVEEHWDDPDMWSVLPSRLYDRLDKVNPPITHKTAYGLGLAVYKGPRRANRALSNVALLWAREAADKAQEGK